MKKFVYFLVIFTILTGCDNTNSQNETNSTTQHKLYDEANTTKNINKAIDEMASKAKNLNENMEHLGKNAIQNIDKFVKENEGEIEKIKEGAIQLLSDANRSFENVRAKASKMINEANLTIDEFFSDDNLTFPKPIIIKNGDNSDLLAGNLYNDEIKQIMQINPNLIQKVAIESNQNSLEITVDGINPINKSEFDDLATKIVQIIRQNNNEVKITIYYLNTFTKYSRRF